MTVLLFSSFCSLGVSVAVTFLLLFCLLTVSWACAVPCSPLDSIPCSFFTFSCYCQVLFFYFFILFSLDSNHAYFNKTLRPPTAMFEIWYFLFYLPSGSTFHPFRFAMVSIFYYLLSRVPLRERKGEMFPGALHYSLVSPHTLSISLFYKIIQSVQKLLHEIQGSF